ncbi:hypothetical protein D3C87_493480 [compost metagenome]
MIHFGSLVQNIGLKSWKHLLATSLKKEAALRLSHTGASMPAKSKMGKDVLLFIGQFKSLLMLMLLGAGILSVFLGDTSDVFIFFFCACAALLDLDNTAHEIVRLPYPLFIPDHDWEIKGEINNVVFPTGTALFGGILYIYYGAADLAIGCTSVNLEELLIELLSHKV